MSDNPIPHSEAQETPSEKKPNILQVTMSVLSAIFGVQKNANRERDFTKGNAADYIGVYIVIVILFVLGMIAVVNQVIDSVQ